MKLPARSGQVLFADTYVRTPIHPPNMGLHHNSGPEVLEF